MMAYDLKRMVIQDGQDLEKRAIEKFTPSQLDYLFRNSESWSVREANHRVIACGGIIEIWPGRGEAWMILSRSPGRRGLLAITRCVRRHLAQAISGKYHRIETIVDTRWCNAHKWASLLGLTREGTMKKCGPDQRDFDLYAMVR